MQVRRLWLLTLVLILPSTASAQTAAEVRRVASKYNVERTMNRLERVVRTAGFRVFVRIDHSREADRASIALRPTQVLIFGRPEVGATLMQADQRAGVDLPLRYLVWLDNAGRVNIDWTDPVWLVQRYALTGHDDMIESLRTAMERFAREAGS